MKEMKVVYYFPRRHFWKLWEKRRVEVVLVETDEKIMCQNFYKTGDLKRDYIRWENGNYTEKIYFMNGSSKEETNVTGDEIRHTCWNRDGKMTLDCRIDRKTQIERRYHPNGQLKIQHNRKTGTYEEWTDTGVLKKKGLWVTAGGLSDSLDDRYAWFETGNMRAKRKNELRGEYIETINAVNELPVTCGRKIAKEALVKAYHESQARIKD